MCLTVGLVLAIKLLALSSNQTMVCVVGPIHLPEMVILLNRTLCEELSVDKISSQET